VIVAAEIGRVKGAWDEFDQFSAAVGPSKSAHRFRTSDLRGGCTQISSSSRGDGAIFAACRQMGCTSY